MKHPKDDELEVIKGSEIIDDSTHDINHRYDAPWPKDDDLETAADQGEWDLAEAILAALDPAPDHSDWNAAIEAAEGAIKAMRGPIDVPRTGKAVVFDDACESCIDVISTLKKGQTND